jgi:hypothetical protein
MERQPYHLEDLFIGDRKLFQEVLQNRETIFVYDIDGILANSPKIVLKNFTEKYEIRTNPAEIASLDYLTRLAKKAGFSEDVIKHAEDGWYKPEVLLAAQRYLYIRPVVRKTVSYYGSKNNSVLTSRNPDLEMPTLNWFNREVPEIKNENILIRKKGDPMSGADFKVKNLRGLAAVAPWVVFVDDATDFTKAAIEANIDNCLVVNIPLGKIMPDFRHERLIIIKRYPEEIQAMYPFMYVIDKVLGA